MSEKWLEEEGIIIFDVVSDGTSGEDWIKRLANGSYNVSSPAVDIISSENFKSIPGTKKVVILKGSSFTNEERVMKNIRDIATKKGFITPDLEVACLIREKLTSEDIKNFGLRYLVIMHKPIENEAGDLLVLCISHDGYNWLEVCRRLTEDCCSQPDYGFVFISK